MIQDQGFAEYVADMLSPLGPVETRPMFGGRNVSLRGLTFGLIVDDVLFLKVDEENRAMFEDAGLGPFVYEKAGKPTPMSYHQAPDCLDDWEALEPWVRGAYAAAARAKAKKPVAKKPVAKKPVAKKPVAKKRNPAH
jgi:DNA transformation protein and related proteins